MSLTATTAAQRQEVTTFCSCVAFTRVLPVCYFYFNQSLGSSCGSVACTCTRYSWWMSPIFCAVKIDIHTALVNTEGFYREIKAPTRYTSATGFAPQRGRQRVYQSALHPSNGLATYAAIPRRAALSAACSPPAPTHVQTLSETMRSGATGAAKSVGRWPAGRAVHASA